ncbi:fibronectin type III domain-containing protein [Planctomycetaceae bacterium]|nr:fibronectin type III domain-containing protein [Planctomycetaceae bacterium]
MLRNIIPQPRPTNGDGINQLEIFTDVDGDNVIDLTSQLPAGATGFTGLATAPRNLAGGTFGAEVDGYYSNMFIATTTNGHLVVIDPDADPGSEIVFVEQWRDITDLESTGATSISLGIGGTTGLAVSPLDINLWHLTEHRESEIGHGIIEAPDGTRRLQDQDDNTNNLSMYFGLEEHDNPSAERYVGNNQFGVADVGGYNWHEELTRNPSIGNNYNLPGGAYGTIETNSFSLDGFAQTDKPSLVFNYWLDTEENTTSGAAGNEMRDSARAFISTDGGVNWEVIATNNSDRTFARDTELPSFVSVSEEIVNTDAVTNQHVQELYDSDALVGSTWRQASVDLGRFAGQPDIRLRFDFSTAGELDANQIDSEGNLINQIDGPAGTTGQFTEGARSDATRSRGQENQFGGFYIDDIIVTTTERGEMVTGATPGITTFIDLETPVISDVIPPQQLQGPYQLEIRRGTEYMSPTTNAIVPDRVRSTNESFTQSNPRGPFLGDSNVIRQQGQFLVQNNIISHASTYGISIDGSRDAVTGAPSSGVMKKFPVLNNERLVPGVVVTNNIVSHSGTAGILFSGDPNTGNVPEAAVPYGRVVNNTVYGGDGSTTGIQITENAAPTLLNNVFASLSTGVDVDGTSSTGTVIGTSAFYAVGTEVNGVTQEFGKTLSSDPFVNAAAGNFYPNSGTENAPNGLIDSSMGSLQDRTAFNTVTEGLGIGESPIVAPERDIYGQLRRDDPDVANTPGLGSEVFKDRGAIERIDDIKPTASLIGPMDQATVPPIDFAPEEVDVVRLVGDDARQVFEFRIQLADEGVGFDKTTVSSSAVTLTKNGTPMVEGIDYIFQYSANLNQIILKSSGVYDLGQYIITLNSNKADLEADPQVAASLTDLAGNPLLTNTTDDKVTFLIQLEGTPEAVSQVQATLQYQDLDPSDGDSAENDASVNLVWNTPGAAANPPILDYIIESSDDGGEIWHPVDRANVNDLVTTETISVHNESALVIGTSYVFRVRAVNEQGGGDWSIQSAPVMPLRLPSAPLELTVSAISGGLTVGWNKPLDDGELTDASDLAHGDHLLDYLVEYSTDAVTWQPHSSSPTEPTPLTISGLTGGVGYHVRVSARNTRGFGATVTSPPDSPSEPTSPPGAVENLELTSVVNGVELNWDAPLLDGGKLITDYVIEFDVDGTGFVIENDGVSNQVGPYQKTLPAGSTVRAKIYAKNSEGNGPERITNVVTVGGAPGLISGLIFVEGDQSVELSWTAPTDRGNYSIIDYVIESALVEPADVDNSGLLNWYPETDVSTETSVVISSHNGSPLVNGNKYSFRVSAKTDLAGGTTGGSLEITDGPAIPHTLPSAPVINAIASSNGAISMAWLAPDDGGKPISDYEVQYKRTSRTNWVDFQDGESTAASATLTGLNNGVSYVVRVRAVNEKGPGPWSAESSSVVPGAVPDAISDLAATPQDGAVALTWTVPASTLTVTSHELQYKKQGDPSWIPFIGTIAIEESAATATVSGLTNGETYDFEVVAVNAVGSSPAASASATPFALPGAVTNFAAVNTGNSVNKSWSAPLSDGGGTITDYVVQYRLASSSTWITFNDGVSTSLSANTTGLSVGQTYVFQVAAKTGFGTGPFTQSGEVTVGSTPVAPARLGAWKEGGNIHVLWDLVQMPAGVTFQYYQIQYREAGVGDWSTIGTDLFNKDVFAGSNFTSGKTYEFRVAAVANTGVGAYRVNLNNVTF